MEPTICNPSPDYYNSLEEVGYYFARLSIIDLSFHSVLAAKHVKGGLFTKVLQVTTYTCHGTLATSSLSQHGEG